MELHDRNKRISQLEKQRMRDKAELDAKDRLIERNYEQAEIMAEQLRQLELKNRQLEELLEQRASETQQLSISVSKMLKEHFGDYQSHSITQPTLLAKLQILESHL